MKEHLPNILLVIALVLTIGCASVFKSDSAKTASYYLVAKGVQAHVLDHPEHFDCIIDVAEILQDGQLTEDEAKYIVEKKLVKANVPDLERELLSQALWDSVDFSALKLDAEKAEHVSKVGLYVEKGARSAYSGSK